jgi:hypothetical protein
VLYFFHWISSSLGEKLSLLPQDGIQAILQLLGGLEALHLQGDIEDGEAGAAQVLS